jgi:glycerophosphoryl diester phosphodiesterase
VIVIGHRGAQGEAPENTVAGVQHAIARGVRHLEIDLRLSADNTLVVVHDDRLKRTTGAPGRVGEMTVSQLARLDARKTGPPWPSRRGTGVPSLDALVTAAPEIKSWQLELKSGARAYNERLVDALVEWLSGRRGHFIVTSAEPRLLKAVKQRLPGLPTGYVSMYPDPLEVLEDCGCTHLVAQWSTLTRGPQVTRLQRQGIEVSTWTVNDASAIRLMHRLNVDSVITDYPSMALPLVASLERA